MKVITADIRKKPAADQGKQRLNMELAEAREISEMLVSRLDAKVQAVQDLEAALDRKTAALERLLRRAEALEKAARAGEAALAALDRKTASVEQLLRRAEELEKKVAAGGAVLAGLDAKAADVERFFVSVSGLENRIGTLDASLDGLGRRTAEAESAARQAVDEAKTGADSRSALFDQVGKRAEALEKRVLAGDSALTVMEKKLNTLEQMVRRAEILSAAGGGTNRQQEIVALNRKGLSPQDIGEVLGMPRGEVELILDLYLQVA